MSGDVTDRKRLIAITDGDIRNGNLRVSSHDEFFPRDAFGPSNRKSGTAKQLTFKLEPGDAVVVSDLAARGGHRYLIRERRGLKNYFGRQEFRAGDVIAIEKLGDYSYRVYPFESKAVRSGTDIPDHWPEPDEDTPTSIDLFAGCGGFSYGLHQAGFQTLLAVEWDAACCRTFETNISRRILNCAIQEIENFPECDLLVGGPPCQGFSNLGERVPDDPRRQLWRHYLRAVEDAHPYIFIMENVPPILKSGEYREIVSAAKSMGYEIDGKVLNSAHYGVPQQRKRAIIIGSRIGDPRFPDPTHRNPDAAPTFGETDLPAWRTVWDAIGDMAPEPDGENWHIGRNPTELSMRRYRAVPPGGNRFDLPKELLPQCWIRKKRGGTDLMGRLWWDRPSVTIRTEFYKPEKGRYLHPVEHRPITHREAARLQGFPDDFDFKGKKIEVGIQIGNAVPPPLGYRIGLAARAEIDTYQEREAQVARSA
ncbi:MAG: DNA cytosine methyltransferase [Phycisphaerae bacterium]